MIRLTLYTTLGCHLCEELEHHLATLCAAEVSLKRVEIADNDELMACYGVRIPVLMDAEGAELDRGFEPERLAGWLAERAWLDNAAWHRMQGEPNVERPAPREAVLRGGRRYLG